MTILVAVAMQREADWIERLRRLAPERKIVALGEPFDRREVHWVVSWRHPHGALAGLPNLAAIFSLGAGVDHLFADPRLPDVPIVRAISPDLTARMSEYVVLHCLLHLRQQRRYDAQQRARVWDDDMGQPAASDVRVGVMGLGELGRDAAEKLRILGFDVAGWSRTRKDISGIETFSGEAGLDPFLARTDILVCLLPLTPDTRGLLDLGLFRKLARNGRLGGPVLINAGRGGLQVEAGILAALNEGSLLAATLDVFETEPLPQESLLWEHPRVTVTPHNAALSDAGAIGRHILTQIARIERGETPDGLVDPARQY